MIILMDSTVPGKPMGKGRPVFARHGDHITTRTPTTTVRWEQFASHRFADAWGPRPPVLRETPVTVYIVALVERTKQQRPGKRGVSDARLVHTGKPDLDNIAKIVLDALVLAGVLTDDTSVTRLVVERWRVAADEVPGVRVIVQGEDSGPHVGVG